MFYYIRGTLVATEPNAACIDVGGVAYRMTISGTTLAKISGKKENVRLYTYLKVSEDAMELFGFAEEEELDIFKLLISISGVGPKAAISILTLMTPSRLSAAVAQEDAKAIAKANGIGAKIAARVVLELKDKLAVAGGEAYDGESFGGVPAVSDNKLSEAANALMVLGYSKSEAMKVLQQIDFSAMTLEECITAALKKMAKQ